MRSILLIALMLIPTLADAQTGTVTDLGGGIQTFHDSSGVTGTITDLGGGFKSYSDSTGRTGMITDLGGGFSTYNISPPNRIGPPMPPAFPPVVSPPILGSSGVPTGPRGPNIPALTPQPGYQRWDLNR